jgi:hypothetical protein
MNVGELLFDNMNCTTRLLRLLSDDIRREVLVSLRHNECITPFSDDTLDQHRVIELHHVHLPLLADYGLIEWDRDSGVVTRGDCFSVITAGLAQGERNHPTQERGHTSSDEDRTASSIGDLS